MRDVAVAQQRILMVDADFTASAELAGDLARHGMQVTRAARADEAARLALARDANFDAIIMESKLPDGDGFALCALFRKSGLQLPIMMLSDATDIADITRGLDAGANDYLAKPYRIASLLARIRAHRRAYQTNSDAMLSIGPLTFNPGKRLLFDPMARRPKRLTAKEAAIFGVLYKAEGKAVDRTQLLHDIWGDNPDLQSHAVEAMVYRLRQKLEPNPSRPTFLLKVPAGYCLADPSRIAAATARAKPETPAKKRPAGVERPAANTNWPR